MPPSSAPNLAPESLPELLRIMDVATALRREREVAAAHLDLDAVKASLRQRLRATADAMGDAVSDAEIEAAIERYFATQHEFKEPPPGLQTLLAHAYVRRRGIAWIAAGVLAFLFGLWAVFVWPNGPLSPESRQARHEREVARLRAEQQARDEAAAMRAAAEAKAAEERSAARAKAEAEKAAAAKAQAEKALADAWRDAQRDHAAIVALAKEPEATTQADGLRREAEAAHGLADGKGTQAAATKLAELRATLEEECELRIVSRPGERSGIDAYYEDVGGKRVSGYYVIVEAVTGNGTVLRRSVRDAEDGRVRSVRKWGEQVPKAVYDRIAADKRADGVVDENVFARKRRGFLSDEVTLLNEGKTAPLTRGRQITTKL